MSEELLKKLLVSVEGIQSDIATLRNDVSGIKENMARHDDLLAVTATLEQITLDEVSVAKEKALDQAEAAYELNKSLIHGLEDQMIQENQILREDIRQLNETVLEGFKKTSESFSSISDLMRAWVYKQTEVDRELQEIKEKLNGE